MKTNGPVSALTIREATPDDAPLVAKFITELATYEKVLDETSANIENLRRDLAADANPRLFCLIAEVDAAPAGFAAYYFAYSTNQTKWGIHLQDLFVRELHRGQKIGEMLLQRLAKIAESDGCEAIELEVLTWNENARRFYERLGLVANPEAAKMYLEEDALKKLARIRD